MAKPSPVIDVQLMRRPAKYAPIEPFPHEAGGECVFLGLTRAEINPKHGKLLRLSYEAYEPMAEAMLCHLAREAAALFECMFVRIHQALGDVELGEASVLVQIACAHRGAAFEACRFGIDSLKRLAPIWKREIWEDGTSWSPGNPVTAGRGF
jgi:molybdopterin synthase catalytic subunit